MLLPRLISLAPRHAMPSRLGVGDGLRAAGLVPADHGPPPSGGDGRTMKNVREVGGSYCNLEVDGVEY